MSKTLREYPLMTSCQSPTVGYPFDSGKLTHNSTCKTSASKFQLRTSDILYNILVGQLDSETSKMESRYKTNDMYESTSSHSSPVGGIRETVTSRNSPSAAHSSPTLGDILNGCSSKTKSHLLSQLKSRCDGPIKVSQYSVKDELKLEEPISHVRRYSKSTAASESREDNGLTQEGRRSYDIPVVQVAKMSINDCLARDVNSSDDSSGSTEGSGSTEENQSRCSRDSYTSQTDIRRGSQEELVEQTRTRLVRLTTASRSPPSFYPAQSILSVAAVKSLSHPGTPPSPPIHQELHRKYSMDNHNLKPQRQKRPMLSDQLRDQVQNGFDPVDLSVKRKKSEPAIVGMNQDGENNSILITALRGRSSTFSFGGRVPDPVMGSVNGSSSTSTGSYDSLSVGANNFKGRVRVTLAKRTLNPVTSRILDRIHAMVNFIADLPEFSYLPTCDQVTLVSGAAHRLLLLFMAESNMEFAVTPVQLEDGSGAKETAVKEESTEGFPEAQGEGVQVGYASRGKKRLEVPTMQFAEGIQNFIAKCHSIAIRPSEYFFMRWIILFHAGANKLERGDLVSNLNTAARQDLQEIISDSHPNDKLRYSKLLLTLHTVFGVNCSMLESLFCAPLQLAGGLEQFACRLLEAYKERNCAVALAATAAVNVNSPETTET